MQLTCFNQKSDAVEVDEKQASSKTQTNSHMTFISKSMWTPENHTHTDR